ncbi:hypothetical protein V2J09_002145 [Rumex salicifolius]
MEEFPIESPPELLE